MNKEKLEELLFNDLKNEPLGNCLDTVEVVDFDDTEIPIYFEAVASYSALVLDKEIELNIVIRGRVINEDEYEVEDLYIE